MNHMNKLKIFKKENEALKMKLSNLEKERLIQQDNIRFNGKKIFHSNVDLFKTVFPNLEKEIYKNKE